MKKRKIAALYDPYLDVMGGGERHILSIMQVLQEQGYEIEIFWDQDLSQQINKTLQLNFKEKLKFRKNIFKNRSKQYLNDLRNYDLFFYVTDGSYFFSTAKKTYIFCMVPKKTLYKMTVFNFLKTRSAKFIANSDYTQSWLAKWGIRAKVIHPYVTDKFMQQTNSLIKKPIILTVGRFFRHLHAKRHDLAIKWFCGLQVKYDQFKGYKLAIVGSLKDEDRDYFNELKKNAASNAAITLYPNVTFGELLKLYRDAPYYWHLAGVGADLESNPENAEHLGIAPLEAMASGCIVFGYDGGGLREIIENGENGLLFQDENTLYSSMYQIDNDKSNQNNIRQNASQFVKSNFSYEKFKKRVIAVLLNP